MSVTRFHRPADYPRRLVPGNGWDSTRVGWPGALSGQMFLILTTVGLLVIVLQLTLWWFL